jgi:sulfur relay (sulfurtransferase) complex TusBCD TusD component (DsrE family)
MPEKNLLIIIRSAPYTTLDYYEGTRVATGLIEHKLKILYTGDGVYAATKVSDKKLTGQFLSDLPDLGVELYADVGAMRERGIADSDLISSILPADARKITELASEAEASLVF